MMTWWCQGILTSMNQIARLILWTSQRFTLFINRDTWANDQDDMMRRIWFMMLMMSLFAVLTCTCGRPNHIFVTGYEWQYFQPPCYTSQSHLITELEREKAPWEWQLRNSLKWSPDGTFLVFDKASTIYLVQRDGSNVRKIVDTWIDFEVDGVAHGRMGNMTYFDVSPDGSRITYSTCRYPWMREPDDPLYDPQSEYWQAVKFGYAWMAELLDYRFTVAIASIDGNGEKSLSPSADRFAVHNYPVWSPDGERIAFKTLRRLAFHNVATGENVEMWRYGKQPPGTELGRVPPAWSPDGRWLAYVSNEDNDPYIYCPTCTLTGSSAPAVYTIRPGFEDKDKAGRIGPPELIRISETLSGPAWSPDGGRIALAAPDIYGGVALYTFAADGSDPVKVAELVTPEEIDTYGWFWLGGLSWSPGGAWIMLDKLALRVAADGSKILDNLPFSFFMESDTENGVRLSRVPMLAAWSPDGSRIAVRTDGETDPDGGVVLYTMDVDGTDPRILVASDGYSLITEASGWQDRNAGPDFASCTDGIVVSEPERNPGLVKDCETLLALQNSLTGGAITWIYGGPDLNWGRGVPIDEWDGVTLYEDGGLPQPPGPRVTELNLPGARPSAPRGFYSLRGMIPPELGDLGRLRVLNLRSNRLKGGIPPDIGRLEDLRELDLSVNLLSGGSIPVELADLTRLEKLVVYGNTSLWGCWPAELEWASASAPYGKKGPRFCKSEELDSDS